MSVLLKFIVMAKIRKLDDGEFRNPWTRTYIRVKEYKGSPARSRSRSHSRSRSPRRNKSKSLKRSASKSQLASTVKSSRPRSKSRNRSRCASHARLDLEATNDVQLQCKLTVAAGIRETLTI